MNCEFSKDLLALDLEGDLPDSQHESVRRHLIDCIECRELLSELRETQSAFKSLRQEDAPASASALVLTRVMDEIACRSSSSSLLRLERTLFGIRWRYAACGAALAAAVAGSLLWEFRPVEEAPRIPIASVRPNHAVSPAPAPERINAGETQKHVPPAVRSRRRGHPAAPPAQPAPKLVNDATEEPRPLMVKLLTDDPAVVIYWIVDDKRGSE